jgi:hypothetical protein
MAFARSRSSVGMELITREGPSHSEATRHNMNICNRELPSQRCDRHHLRLSTIETGHKKWPVREGQSEKASQRRPVREGQSEKASQREISNQRRPVREGQSEKASQREISSQQTEETRRMKPALERPISRQRESFTATSD